MESGLTQSLKSAKLWYCQPSYMHVRPKLPEKTPKDQVTRQDPGYRSPEEGRNAKHAYSSEACRSKMD